MTPEARDPLASEQGHWYDQQGKAVYEVPRAKGDGMRPTTLADARKLNLVPSVTLIQRVAAKPGLEAWKAEQLLDSALTLPMLEGELADDYKKRVITDAGEKSLKARERGTELHAAIEDWIRGVKSLRYEEHCQKIEDALSHYGIDGIDLRSGNSEHSFASPLGYGGKIDWHSDEPLVIDFKTKDRIEDKKPLVYDEHVQQLAAYGFGIASRDFFRAMNVFIGVEDKQVRTFEHSWEELVNGFECFKLLLEYWKRTKNFGEHSR